MRMLTSLIRLQVRKNLKDIEVEKMDIFKYEEDDDEWEDDDSDDEEDGDCGDDSYDDE